MDQCDYCAYYVCSDDEDDGEYYCSVEIDQDDYYRIMAGDRKSSCPYFRDGDEYKVVRHQM